MTAERGMSFGNARLDRSLKGRGASSFAESDAVNADDCDRVYAEYWSLVIEILVSLFGRVASEPVWD